MNPLVLVNARHACPEEVPDLVTVGDSSVLLEREAAQALEALMAELDAKLISCGDDRHYDNFITGVNRYGFDIYGIQRAFRDVLSKGVLFDDFIDKNAQFELIRRPG